VYGRNDQANNQALESTPMPHYTNYSIKRSGKTSHFTNVTPTEMNYVDTLIISIPKSNSPNMRNTTRMSNPLDSMRSQTSGLLLVKMEVLLWLGGLYPQLDLLPRLIFPLWRVWEISRVSCIIPPYVPRDLHVMMLMNSNGHKKESI
jgi:hypothetical protein